MDPEYERYRAALAGVITSDIVGGLHLRRVGELLVARERMNERVLTSGGGVAASRGSDAQFVEAVLEHEERICAAWEACQRGSREWRHETGLDDLADALKAAADLFDAAADA